MAYPDSLRDREQAKFVNVSDETAVKVFDYSFNGLVKLDYADGLLAYVGKNIAPSATDSDATWVVQKLTYSGGLLSQIQTKSGSWSGRVALFS